MDTTAITVLIVLLSVGFIILLSLSIALIVIIIEIMRSIRRITDKAELATDNISDLAAMVSKRVAPVALSAAFAAAMRRFKRNEKE